jgi:hypothetical protein
MDMTHVIEEDQTPEPVQKQYICFSGTPPQEIEVPKWVPVGTKLIIAGSHIGYVINNKATWTL